MKIDTDQIKSNYELKDTSELLSLHESGSLSDEAYLVLESVLASRHVPIPKRPLEQVAGASKPLPLGLQIVITVTVIFVSFTAWQNIFKPLVGGGAILHAIFTILPPVFIWMKLSPRNAKKGE